MSFLNGLAILPASIDALARNGSATLRFADPEVRSYNGFSYPSRQARKILELP
jgi:hypothetical protein